VSTNKAHHTHWGRWAAGLAGLLVTLKTLAFLVSRIFRLTKNEVSSRGRDVDFVLGLAGRRSSAQ
jgi:hypothetical protein